MVSAISCKDGSRVFFFFGAFGAQRSSFHSFCWAMLVVLLVELVLCECFYFIHGLALILSIYFILSLSQELSYFSFILGFSFSLYPGLSVSLPLSRPLFLSLSFSLSSVLSFVFCQQVRLFLTFLFFPFSLSLSFSTRAIQVLSFSVSSAPHFSKLA